MSEQKCPVCPTKCREQSLYDPSNFTNTHSPVIFTPKSEETSLPSLLLLSLSHNALKDPPPSDKALFEKLKTVSNLYRATTLDDAVDYLETHQPIAILVTDAGITDPENDYLVDHLKSYVFHGGRVIFALSFPRFFVSTSPSSDDEERFNYFFTSKWGLPWRMGECIRQEYEFAPWCALPEGVEKGKLEGVGRMVADVLGVRGAGVEEFLFTPVLRGEVRRVDWTQMGFVGTGVGEGWLGYVGAVGEGEGEGEGMGEEVVFRLCGF